MQLKINDDFNQLEVSSRFIIAEILIDFCKHKLPQQCLNYQ